MSNVRFVDLDGHADTIAVAELNGEARSHGVIPNRPESVRKPVRKLGPAKRIRACYETGNAHLRRVQVEAAWAYQHRPHRRYKVLAARSIVQHPRRLRTQGPVVSPAGMVVDRGPALAGCRVRFVQVLVEQPKAEVRPVPRNRRVARSRIRRRQQHDKLA